VLATMAPPRCRDVSPHSLPTARTSETASALSILVLAALRYGRTEPLLPESSPKRFPLPGVVREPGIIERVQCNKGEKEGRVRGPRRSTDPKKEMVAHLLSCRGVAESKEDSRLRYGSGSLAPARDKAPTMTTMLKAMARSMTVKGAAGTSGQARPGPAPRACVIRKLQRIYSKV
jgi:hypothetical protein